jgi:hypothetical protein
MSEKTELRQIVEDKLTGIHATLKANTDISNERHAELLKELKDIKEKQDTTNSRVTKLEIQTKPLRFLFYKKPIIGIVVTLLLAYSIVSSIEFEQAKEIVNFLYKLL